MVQMYVKAIKSGRITIENVPTMYRKQVEEIIVQE
jgi:hypothetical protein